MRGDNARRGRCKPAPAMFVESFLKCFPISPRGRTLKDASDSKLPPRNPMAAFLCSILRRARITSISGCVGIGCDQPATPTVRP